MALLTLGGVLKACGTEAELWDFDLYFKNAGNLTESAFRKMLRLGVRGAKSPVFGISSICSNFPMALWIAREIKACRPEALVILGGPQPSSVPLEILERFEFVDMVVVGEGETTLREMVEADFHPKRLEFLPGLALRVEGKAVLREKRSLTENMDDLPPPDYSLIDFRDYVAAQGEDFLPHVEVGRGCPFHCTFCSTALMWEKDFRVKSPERILREMEWLNEHHGFERFDFIHDNFTTSRKFVSDFCDFMAAHNTRSLEWFASSRTDCLDVNRLEKMHSVGLRGLFFGVESGSERMQAIIRKNLDFERFLPILRRGNELGVEMTTAFILGFPEETLEDLDQLAPPGSIQIVGNGADFLLGFLP
ncbi:MAG: radical SAM protein [bacterium]